VSDACGCAQDLIKPIRPDFCYPVGDISALERAMAAAITNTPPTQLLRAHISKYDISKTIDAVEHLYLERAWPFPCLSNRVQYAARDHALSSHLVDR
jgi:hypothetical protein